jgi:hypothetical protein
MLLRQLFEAANNEVAIIFGRFNPPHKGHRAAWEMASKSPVWFVGTNESTVGPKDPLPFDVKVEAMKTVWPKVEGHVVAETSWLTLASKVYEQYPQATLLCLTDEDWVTKTIIQYNGKEGAHGFYKFTNIKQSPTPRLSSATALRDAVAKGDREAFTQAAGVSADTKVAGKPFFDLVAEYLMPYQNAPKKVVKKKKEPEVVEDWNKVNKQDKTDGLSQKAVNAYRRENPGSKLKTAVTTKPSKLKAGSKDAKRRKSFCARMSGNKGPMKDEKGRPTPKAKALSRWNCNEEQGVAEGKLGTAAALAGAIALGGAMGYKHATKDPNAEPTIKTKYERNAEVGAKLKKKISGDQKNEGAPIVVAQAPIHIRNPKKAPQPYRNKGDIVPDTKPPSTEKRGVKGRPGQRPMPKYDEDTSDAMASTASRLSNKDDGKVAKLRAAGDKRREEELKGRNIAKKNESLKHSLQELSNDMLGKYKKAAGADASKADKEGNVKRGDKRFSGIVKATNKQFANDAKKTK